MYIYASIMKKEAQFFVSPWRWSIVTEQSELQKKKKVIINNNNNNIFCSSSSSVYDVIDDHILEEKMQIQNISFSFFSSLSLSTSY